MEINSGANRTKSYKELTHLCGKASQAEGGFAVKFILIILVRKCSGTVAQTGYFDHFLLHNALSCTLMNIVQAKLCNVGGRYTNRQSKSKFFN